MCPTLIKDDSMITIWDVGFATVAVTLYALVCVGGAALVVWYQQGNEDRWNGGTT